MQSSKSAVWVSSTDNGRGGEKSTDCEGLSRCQSIALYGHYFGSDSNE